MLLAICLPPARSDNVNYLPISIGQSRLAESRPELITHVSYAAADLTGSLDIRWTVGQKTVEQSKKQDHFSKKVQTQKIGH